jgi:hypothetical protein
VHGPAADAAQYSWCIVPLLLLLLLLQLGAACCHGTIRCTLLFCASAPQQPAAVHAVLLHASYPVVLRQDWDVTVKVVAANTKAMTE